MLAGVPMMNGAATLEGYMPEFDATDRRRACWMRAPKSSARPTASRFCLSGGSHTERNGPGA